MFELEAAIWQSGQWHTVVISGSTTIESIVPRHESQHPERRLLPGCIDCHVHGGGGVDVMSGEGALREMLQVHASLGVSGLVATTVTASDHAINQVIDAATRVMAAPDPGSARLFGVHLEGPYLSPERLGAQPPETRLVEVDRVEGWFDSGIVRILTYAPEADPDHQLPALAKRYGVRLQLGHTNCSYAQAALRISQGQGVTHLYNAMSGVSHRGGGLALASLCHSEFAELICDGVHVDPPAVHLARKAISKLYVVSDATAAAGMPDGPYQLGALTVYKKGDSVRLADGTLAGSAVTGRRMVTLAREWGFGWQEIANRFSTYPAQWLQVDDQFGAIRVGAAADFLELDGETPVATWVAGQRITHRLDLSEP